ncbi:acetylxylan esterase [bacterium]|nr:MAG: acetylxylan esterase [bacterium]
MPDPLVCNDGTRVTAADQWWSKRRPEIVEHFDREIYGRVPADVPGVTWTAGEATTGTVGSFATRTTALTGRVDNSAHPEIDVAIEATLTLPAEAQGPVPVIVEFGFRPRPRPNATSAATSRPRATMPAGPSWQEQVLAKGWGYAILYPTSYQADDGAGLTRGIIGLANKGRPRKPGDWGALRAWAWGVSRLIDYFETNPAVDAKQVGIEGLSRFGKATAVAMAYEPRLAIAFVGSSGQGGVKIMRRDFGERVENVASSAEYHWMAGNYLKYAGPLTPNDLPIDAHELVALCAPRPVFISVGSLNVEGTWIDAVGNFLGGAHATPVYELLGKKGLNTQTMPAERVGLLDGEIAFRMHEGGHTTGPNWPAFLEWAGRYVRPPSTTVNAKR